jgi:hypothetical protein
MKVDADLTVEIVASIEVRGLEIGGVWRQLNRHLSPSSARAEGGRMIP